MLEALLNHFRLHGMEDLEFIIVNSKLSHAQEKLQELQKRVSFSVYQETDTEEVWSVMEGGKDDMFVYDRCGRLTYYVPFPSSILNEYPLVSNAILATYYRSPCGVTCDKNETLDIEAIVKNIQDDSENSTNMSEDSAMYTTTEEELAENSENSTSNYSLNSLLEVIDAYYELSNQNNSDFINGSNIEHSVNNSTHHVHEPTNSTVGKATEYFNSLYRLFFNIGNSNDLEENSSTINVFNETDNTPQIQDNLGNSTNHTIHSHHHHNHTKFNDTEEGKTRKKSDRCVEADYAVCKSWSKKRLLNAQKCCSGVRTDDEIKEHKSCHHFGKKRCKKIQSILKCCIKTVYTEETEPPPTTTETPPVTETSDIICCRIINEGKECRVSNVRVCNEGEFIEESSAKSK